ncbi:MAG: DUF6880 family protein [Brevundimonas sp.]|uniref:DUF6880 family protein n=1 Tax=Brevundimonas sp. TaxID=1871086 RepID=UPI0040332133
MAKAAPKPKKTVSEANLATLGAERLAALLIEFATGDAALKRRLRMELSAEVGPGDLALELDKRLVSLAESRAKVSWRKRPGLLTELRAIKRVILERLAPLDTRLALDRLVAWFDLYVPLRSRVSDPKGEMTLMFDEASADLAVLASGAGVDVAGPVLGEALSTRLSEWASWVGRGAGDLSPELARRLLHDLTAGRPRPTGRAALLVRKLADRSGDLDAWLTAVPDDDRAKPEVGSEIARRLATAGRPDEARAALEAARPVAPTSRWSRKDVTPEPPPEPWLRAEIAVLLAEGRKDDADEARWRLFANTLSPELIREIVAGLADFDDVEALDRAFGVAAGHPDVMRGLGFLMNWPALREAAALVLSRRDELRGAVEDVPLWSGRLAARYPEAALLLVRARARALARLGNGMDDELRAVLSEAEGLAANADLEPSHAVFAGEIDGLISRKRPVWR